MILRGWGKQTNESEIGREKKKKAERENNEIKFLPQLIRSRSKAKCSKVMGAYSVGYSPRQVVNK